jgi:hypothetical protein
VIAQASGDAQYRKRLVAEPKKVLKDAGYEVDPKIDYRVVLGDKNQRYVVLPTPDNVEGVRAALERLTASLEHLPQGFEWRIVQNTSSIKYIPVRTEKPGEISDDDLEKIAGGGSAAAYSNVGVATEVAGAIYAVTAAVAT